MKSSGVSDADTSGMRKRIMQMAARLFVMQGYHGISMREIAAACDLSKAGLYYHFKDKEDLFLAILEENLQELERIVAQARQEQGGVQEQIAFFVRAVFTRLLPEQQAVIRIASQEMGKISTEARAAFDRRYQQAFLGQLAGILEEGVRAGVLREVDPWMGVWGLLGLMYPFFHAQEPGDAGIEMESAANADRERVIDFVLTTFLEGVKAHG